MEEPAQELNDFDSAWVKFGKFPSWEFERKHFWFQDIGLTS